MQRNIVLWVCEYLFIFYYSFLSFLVKQIENDSTAEVGRKPEQNSAPLAEACSSRKKRMHGASMVNEFDCAHVLLAMLRKLNRIEISTEKSMRLIFAEPFYYSEGQNFLYKKPQFNN